MVSLRGAKKPPSGKLPADVRHYAFAAGSVAALAGWRRRLKAKGVAFWEERHGSQHSLYFADPNGTILEVTAPASRPAKKTKRAALAAAKRWIARGRT